MNEWMNDEQIQRIVEFVAKYRAFCRITPTQGRKDEPSCIAFGEGHNLLFRQLVLTPEFEGGWRELKDSPEIVDLVIEEIESYEAKHPEVYVA